MTASVQMLDGGLSTALERLGYCTDHALWTAAALIDAPDAVVAAHRAFLDAGADVILTASYQAGIANLSRHVAGEAEARRILASSVELARRAVALAGGTRARVAASLGAYGALLADRSEYHGRYPVPWSEVAREQRARVEVLLATGVDLVVCETLPTVTEAEVTLDVVRQVLGDRQDVEVWVTFTATAGGRSAGGEPLVAAAEVLAARPWVRATGVNCTDPRHVPAALDALSRTGLPLIAKPNRLPHIDELARWVGAGVRHLGGCCGVGPAELAEITSSTF